MANFMIRFLICNVFISGIIGILLICLTAEKLYGGLPYQEAYTEQRGNPDVLCGG